MILFTHTGGVGVSQVFTTSKCPQSIQFVASTVPTSLKVIVDGVTVKDLDATGISAEGRIRNIGIGTNLYDVTLADGEVDGQTRIEITTGAAGAMHVMGSSFNVGAFLSTTQKETATANSGYLLKGFAYACIPALVSGDRLEITYKNQDTGELFQQRIDDPSELRFLNGYKQALQNNGNDLFIDNLEGIISEVKFYPIASRDMYVCRYQVAPSAIKKG